ncbi:including n-acetylases of ribosomal protein [Lentinus tigrinus ALCF2SS1-6]|uniref:Including n-acetylases of ribosomal protein n=1 Tax=Lentinus tigrinus ALCF2SS1-6 TaxID=1328759 RepID=A0A5C2SJ41_9APHY|nr:including n-acetylases of ribosomal protein [Lentinus tigrinus ALCF2SS1-6]
MTDANFHIETPRLYISYFQPALDSHCDFLVRLYNTPEFIATCGRSPITTRAIARDRLATRFVADHARNGYGIYLVSLKPSDPGADAAPAAGSDSEAPVQLPAFQDKLARCKLIGTVSLMRGSDAVAYAVPDLGFAVLPEEMRKGYAREASAGLLDYVRREKGVDVVLGLTDPKNEGAKGVFRSLGFEDRGVRKLAVFGNVDGAVWISPGAAEDLSVYNLNT